MTDFLNSLDIMALSSAERLLLAQQLLDSVLVEAMPLAPREIAEVRRRATALDAGEAKCEAWGGVKLRLLPPG